MASRGLLQPVAEHDSAAAPDKYSSATMAG
jgi:hypothetical protein